MDNQPAPAEKIACAQCRFARLVLMSPNDIQRQLTCRFLPPQNVVVFTNQGPQLMGSGFPVVAPDMWCFQFKRAAAGEIDSESPPKMGEGDSQRLLS